jgi:hypothetical protein
MGRRIFLVLPYARLQARYKFLAGKTVHPSGKQMYQPRLPWFPNCSKGWKKAKEINLPAWYPINKSF